MSTDTHTIPLDVLPVSEGKAYRQRDGGKAMVYARLPDGRLLGVDDVGEVTVWQASGKFHIGCARLDIMGPWVDLPKVGEVWRGADGDEREILAIRDDKCVYWNRSCRIGRTDTIEHIATGTYVGMFEEGGE